MASPSAGKPLRFWLILILCIAALCVAALLILRSRQETGGLVQVTQSGEVVGTYPLDEPATLRFESDNGGWNEVVSQDGAVLVAQASCPDQVCVRHGATSQTGDPIVCLPNGLVVEVIANETAPQLDGVT